MAVKKKTSKKGFPPKKGDMDSDSKRDKSMSKKSKGKKNC